ncbi:heme exporter protein CcmD [Lysobacter solisilvae (ex Woo and Kim 2022)]|uniref:Heme exporter protein D n=1 Tax=Agrilutibacter terrestris TaxID=2865112 RepID=A0A7H0FXX0_9GAMM|nr:heme exporter protein CcmD [Lysobacter terrestris]QNP40886.1 heme exporter protein CcmD [Lysobacter terrestris]
MSYLNYLIAAYAVFVIVLGWDYVATHLQIRRQLRNARLRSAREAARATKNELSR